MHVKRDVGGFHNWAPNVPIKRDQLGRFYQEIDGRRHVISPIDGEFIASMNEQGVSDEEIYWMCP